MSAEERQELRQKMTQRRMAINKAKEEAKQREVEAEGPIDAAASAINIPGASSNQNNNVGGGIDGMTEDEMIQAAINASL